MAETLDFDSEPNEFPQIWVAGDEETIVKIDDIINKHVYLALRSIIEDIVPLDGITKDGHAAIHIVYDDMGHFQTEIDLEKFFLELTGDECGPNTFRKMAASLRKCADNVQKLADESTIVDDEEDMETPDKPVQNP